MRTALPSGNSFFRQTAGGLKLTSVSGELTLNEAAVLGSTGGERTINLIDLCQLYHGHDQTDQLIFIIIINAINILYEEMK